MSDRGVVTEGRERIKTTSKSSTGSTEVPIELPQGSCLVPARFQCFISALCRRSLAISIKLRTMFFYDATPVRAARTFPCGFRADDLKIRRLALKLKRHVRNKKNQSRGCHEGVTWPRTGSRWAWIGRLTAHADRDKRFWMLLVACVNVCRCFCCYCWCVLACACAWSYVCEVDVVWFETWC